jgi:hypothetical protein
LTVNNPLTGEDGFDEQTYISGILGNSDIFVHGILGYEGYNTYNPHFQMAVCFVEPKGFKEVKALFPRAHIESLKNAYYKSVYYCMKEGSSEEYGDLFQAEGLNFEFTPNLYYRASRVKYKTYKEYSCDLSFSLN